MSLKSRLAAIVLLAVSLVAIAGCGQTGPLMLPDQTVDADEEESDDENGRN